MRARLATVFAIALLAPAGAGAQIPEPTNLQVLPDSMTRDEVIAVMRGFTAALGVRCPYCHVGREGMPLDSFDFASDDKHEKEMARGMMRMVAEINGEILPEIFDHHERPAARVECMTCHRGATRPVMLEDTLAVVVERTGADSMAAEYLRLRERHYGRFAYDFGERSLTLLATRLSAAGKHAEAIRALEMNAVYYPESASVAFELGRVYEAMKDAPRAIEQYRKALQLQPDHAGAKRRLDALSAAG